MSGVILELDKFRSHLDVKGVTDDKDLELKHFEYARRTLAEIWSSLVTDGNPVVVEFIEDKQLLSWERSQTSGKHVSSGIATCPTNFEMDRSKMLLELSIIIFESCP